MAKNLLRYYQAWQLRKQGKTFREIGEIMGFSIERARTLVTYIRFIMRKKNDDYKKLISMLRKVAEKDKNHTKDQLLD